MTPGDEVELARFSADRARQLDLANRRARGRPSSYLWTWLRLLLSRTVQTYPEPLPVPTRGECAISWLGHATVLLRYATAGVIVDPCFARWLWGLRRAREPAVPPGALDTVDLALITHAHADHLHRPSLQRLPQAATAVVPPGCSRALGRRFRKVIELEPGGTHELPHLGLQVTAVQARHPVGGGRPALGFVVRGDGPTVYASGDTGYFAGFAEVGARFRPDVALLPISSYRPGSLRRGHLSPLDAIYAFEDLGAQLLVPIHHGDFALGYEPLGEPAAWLRELERARRLEGRVAWLEPGQSCVARRAE